MQHQIIVMTQEDDLDYIADIYNTRGVVNDGLYAAIHDIEVQLNTGNDTNDKLTKCLTIAEAGTDKETMEKYKEIDDLDAKTKAYRARTDNLEKKIMYIRDTSVKLEVGRLVKPVLARVDARHPVYRRRFDSS